MKLNRLLSFFCLLLAFSVNAQSAFQITPNPVVVVEPDSVEIAVAHAEIKNTSNSNVTIQWTRYELSIPMGITTQVCDCNLCWAETVGQKSIQMTPGQTCVMDVHFNNFEKRKASDGVVLIVLRNQAVPADTLRVFYYYNPSTGTAEAVKTVVQLYPNPAADFFRLQYEGEPAASVQLLQADGRLAREYNSTSNGNYAVDGLTAGLYFVVVRDGRNRIIGMTTLDKR